MRFPLMILGLLLPLYSASLYTISSVHDLDGNWEIRTGNIRTAEDLLTNKKAKDPEYQLMKQAELAILKKDYSEAKRFLLAVISRSVELTPFAYRRIGDIELLLNDPSHAIVAFRTAAEKTDLKPYRYYLVQRADSITKANQQLLKSEGWHALAYTDSTPTPQVSIDTVFVKLKERLSQGVTEVQLDSLLGVASKAGKGMDLKKSIRDTAIIREPFSVNRIYEHSIFLNEIGAYSDASQWINIVSSRPDFSDSVNQKSYLPFRASLNYTLKNWENVTKYSEEYFKLYGYTADLVLKTARSYRNMGNDKTADFWYSDFVSRYPNANESQDILWYKAWQAEEQGELDSAIARFSFIASTMPDYKYADDAAFRIGLNQYRNKEYLKAIDSFKAFAKTHKNSPLVPGTEYWQARCYEGLNNDSLRIVSLTNTISLWPLDYYAWRAREALGTKDTASLSRSSFDSWFEKVKKISHDPKDTLAVKNSAKRFQRAVQLGTLGYFDEARLLIEPIQIRSSKNPAQLFELSKFYELIGEHQKAFKISKSIYYSIPVALRKDIPEEFINRLYPRAYPEAITESTQRFKVNQHLVRAIMRQESMFHPTIKSPVGAMGLMQIMSYTGKEISADLDTSYADSYLFNPSVNIKFGTFYIGKLLKQFDGDYVKAIASYNGGPHNVKKWIEANRSVLSDPVYFTECIGFSETRNYVKRVLENYWIYETLNRSYYKQQ